MGEIIEKGLMIGFGLTICIFLVTLLSPFLSILSSDHAILFDEHDSFAFTIEYGFSYTPKTSGEELRVNMSISIEITLYLEQIEENFYLNISSTLRTTCLYCPCFIILTNATVTGDFETVFYYFENLINLAFWGS